MCLAVYIASNHELPLVPWNENAPSFYVSELSDYDTEVRKQFTVPDVRHAGSDAGCGCGFFKDGVVGQELIEAEQNYAKLAAYIEDLRSRGAAVELFSCWQGDQSTKKEFNEQIDVDDLLEKNFEFKEKAFYEIKGKD